MPYELGVFVGFRHAGVPNQGKKKILILDRERFRYQEFLSDIAGQDIRTHGNDPMLLLREVRHWLQSWSQRELVGIDRIRQRFEGFLSDVPAILARLHKTEADLENYRDFHNLVTGWITENPPP